MQDRQGTRGSGAQAQGGSGPHCALHGGACRGCWVRYTLLLDRPNRYKCPKACRDGCERASNASCCLLFEARGLFR